MRKGLNGMKSEDAVEQILNMFVTHERQMKNLSKSVKKQKYIYK